MFYLHKYDVGCYDNYLYIYFVNDRKGRMRNLGFYKGNVFTVGFIIIRPTNKNFYIAKLFQDSSAIEDIAKNNSKANNQL